MNYIIKLTFNNVTLYWTPGAWTRRKSEAVRFWVKGEARVIVRYWKYERRRIIGEKYFLVKVKNEARRV